MTPRHLLLFVFSLFTLVEVQAQTTGGNPQNTLLPEINPQDIEIRSEFRARFPGLRRQPILGFNPKPRVFQIDPNRMPFMESKSEAVASIAITQLDRPEPPARQVIQTPPRTTGWLRTGIGNFISPEAEGYFFHGLNEKSALSGNLNYRSSNGHLDDQLSSFRYFDGDLRFTTKTNNGLHLTTSAGFLSDFNRMFDLAPIYMDPTNNFTETAPKTYLGGVFGVTAEKTKNAFSGWKADLSGTTYSTDLDAGTTAFTGTGSEQTVNLNMARYWPGNRLYETFQITGDLQAGTYKYTGLTSQNWALVSAGADYRKLINFSMHVSASANVAYASDSFSQRLYFAPEFKISYNLKDAITVEGRIAGAPSMQTMQQHHQNNRFLGVQTMLQHAYTSGAYGKIVFQAFEGNQVYGGLSYEIVKNYAWYDRNSETRIGTEYQTFYGLNYGKANIFELYAGITQQLKPEKFWFDAKAYVRTPTLEGGGDIPFEERIGVNGSLVFVPIQKLKVSSWAEYTGPRQAPASGRELDGFILLNAGAEYQINAHFGVYVKVLNMLGQKYELWDGYQERPIQAFGGLILKI